MDHFAESDAFCPYYHRAMELIGRRWTAVILRAMISGVQRFSDLVSAIPGLSDRMLSERLKELEFEGLVERTVIPETPVRVEYHLTEKGRALGDVMSAVSQWAHDWLVMPEGSGARGEGPGDGEQETESARVPAKTTV